MTTLGFDNNGSNSAQESSPSEESNDSSGDFSANKPSTSKKMAQNIARCVHMASEEAFEQGHMIDRKISTKQTQNLHNSNHYPIFDSFPKFGNIVCSTRQVIAFEVQAVSFLQLPHNSLRQMQKNSSGLAVQNGVKLTTEMRGTDGPVT